MLVDLDYFFAQCEELRNPALKDKAVVVGVYSGRTEESGAVSTANYVARKYGVKSGMALFLAKQKLEDVDAVFLPVDHEFYEQVSNAVMRVLKGYGDVFEQVGIDEAYLDVSGKLDGNIEAGRNLVEKIKAVVKSQVGVTFSVGIGPNKLIAKIASDAQKPDGVTLVRSEDVQDFLSPLPVDRLLGVGRKIAAKMATLDISTVGDLAKYDVQRLVEVYGKSLGVYFHNAANGIDNEPVQEAGEFESVSRIATLKENTRDLVLILEKTDVLIEDLQKELVQRNTSFKQVGIIAVFADLSVRSRSLTLAQPTREQETLKRTIRELFEKLLDDSTLEIRRVGVKVSHFMKEEKTQKQLTSFFAN
jgi:DNA polymerase IV (DinB-like DNA polymerase)